MKKIAFALYALGILIVLPIIVTIEFNRKPTTQPSVQNTGIILKDYIANDEAYAYKETLLFRTSF